MGPQQVGELQVQGRAQQPENEPWTSPKQMILRDSGKGTWHKICFIQGNPALSIPESPYTEHNCSLQSFSRLTPLQEGNQRGGTQFPKLSPPTFLTFMFLPTQLWKTKDI